MKVFLSGPIKDLSYALATNWRNKVCDRLRPIGITCLSPLRNKKYLKDQDNITSELNNIRTHFYENKFDIMNSDIILVNLSEGKEISIGSLFELAWGHLLNKYCVVVMNEISPYRNHFFIKEAASIIFEKLDDAVDYIAETFGG